jgi:two-component system, LuxR family, response regulator FixJ
MNPEPTVFIVDDDAGALDSFCYLLNSADLHAEGFASAEEFLNAYEPERPGCLVLDLRMPRVDGLQLLDELIERRCDLPVIVLTAHGDVAVCARMFKSGVFDFLEKPADGNLLLERIRAALDLNLETRRNKSFEPEIAGRLDRLTLREREVLDLLIHGYSVKELARHLQIDHRTAAKHRARVQEKMDVHNDAELVRLMLSRPKEA